MAADFKVGDRVRLVYLPDEEDTNEEGWPRGTVGSDFNYIKAGMTGLIVQGVIDNDKTNTRNCEGILLVTVDFDCPRPWGPGHPRICLDPSYLEFECPLDRLARET